MNDDTRSLHFRNYPSEFERTEAYKQFVNLRLPIILQDISEEILTVNRLMEAQYRCVDAVAETALYSRERMEKERNSLSQYKVADVFLDVLGISEREYCLFDLGLSDDEFDLMQRGELTVGDIARNRPEVFMEPIIRSTRVIH